MYDILITVAEKDYNKLPFVLESIKKYLCGFNEIHIVSPTKIQFASSKTFFHLDRDVVDFDFSKFKGNIALRKGWYIQQFIKLFQKVTSNDYLVVDSDVYFNRKVEIIENGNPCFLLGENQQHPPYFDFTKKVLGFGREFPHSFINEIMYFKRDIIEKMISPWSKEGFFEITVNALNQINHPTSSFSEYETYGNYVYKHFPEMYNVKYIKTKTLAKYRNWTKNELNATIEQYTDQDYDKISMHSWI
jgi:hypothetical protein